jgi:ABC-type polysaccharide/polyol phosphate export permease
MTTTADPAATPELRDPSGGGGLVDVVRRRYLLKLLVRKELKVRYQGTVLGVVWSYIQPLTRFCVYYVIIGIVLGMNRSVPNFAVHIVAGLVVVHFFTETFKSTTGSVVKNKSLVRKVGLPREMFPVSSTMVSAVNAGPGLVVLFCVAVLTGWHITWDFVPALVLAFLIVVTWGFGLGLLFSAFNVYYRDFTRVVQTITTLLPWSCPMIYAFEMVSHRFADHPWALEIYLANPCALAVQLSQTALWVPTLDGTPDAGTSITEMAPHLYTRAVVMVVVGLLFVALAQKAFSRLEASFAEQL